MPMISKSKCGHPACNCVPDYTEVESLRRALSQWDLQVLETGPPTPREARLSVRLDYFR